MGKEMSDAGTPCVSKVLVLTNNRSTQQNELIKKSMLETRKRNRGKPFHLKDKPPRYCKSTKSTFVSLDVKGNILKINFKNKPCNTWACPSCGPLKAIRLKYRITNLAILNKLDHLMTLTLNPNLIPKEFTEKHNETGLYITKLFNRFRLKLSRLLGRKLKYVWVKEFQTNGNAHLHILINGYIPDWMILKSWKSVGGGHILDMQYIKNIEAAAKYVTNYIVKGLKHDKTNKNTFIVGERRYSISKSCIENTSTYPKPTKINSISELKDKMSVDKFFDVYNMIQDSAPEDKELIFAPYQEKLKI